MVVVGVKTQPIQNNFLIAKTNCEDSYLIETEEELKKEWFLDKKHCGISAGASTPDWIIQKVIAKIKILKLIKKCFQIE